MTRLVTSGVAALIASGGLLVLGLPADAAPVTADVSPTRGAWYATSPTCVVPVGCGSDVTTTSYPADTLHVGVTSGQEAARAYLAFSSSALSADVTVAEGQLVVPVDPGAGTTAPGTAALQLCLVPGGLAQPAPDAPPPVDCAISSPATHLSGTPSAFVADLAPFLSRGRRLNGLALALVPARPAAGAAPTSSWHVAFSSPGRRGGQPVVAQLELAPAPATTAPPAPRPPVVVPEAPEAVVPPLQPPPAVPPGAQPPPVAVGPGTGQSGLVPQAFTIEGHRFGVLWAMPLGLFLLGWAFVTTCRRDLRSYARPVRGG